MSALAAVRAGLVGLTVLLIAAPILIVVVTAFSPTDFFVFPQIGRASCWEKV